MTQKSNMLCHQPDSPARHTARAPVNHPLKSFLCRTQTAYLSQVDVNSVLQELGGLSGPLLNGQHPDCLHAGLQLNHACILVLREIRGEARKAPC